VKLAVVTATIDVDRAEDCIRSWERYAAGPLALYVVNQGAGEREWEVKRFTNHSSAHYRSLREIAGVVPAFAVGLHKALHDGADVIACLHDDLEFCLGADVWDQHVLACFEGDRRVGLVGFGGATGLGDDDIYQSPYRPMQLVRKRFGSNMRDAESHGERWVEPKRIACLDGFSQIGRREFWQGYYQDGHGAVSHHENLFQELASLGVMHHAYDSALGAYAALGGWETWFLPVPVHHYGGRTAVGDTRYHAWADGVTEHARGLKEFSGRGDQFFWEQSHRAVYDLFKDRGVLPLRIE
jgi:hypothetical protein